jgi:hypothetical protein
MPIWPILPNSQSMRDREDINRMRDQPKNPGMGTAESRCRALWTEQGVPAAEQDRLIALITSQAEHPPRFPPQPAAAPAKPESSHA